MKDLVERFQKEMDEEMMFVMNKIASGNCEDYATYKEKTGMIAAYQIAKNTMEDLLKSRLGEEDGV